MLNERISFITKPMTIEEFSKYLENFGRYYGQKEIMDLLSSEGHLVKQGRHLGQPSQVYLDNGYMATIAYTWYESANNISHTMYYPAITFKGLNHFLNLFPLNSPPAKKGEDA